jgi:NDP-sugar pyrophosphorylase family protein
MLPDTERLPKCLLPVAGRPFVDWQLAWLAAGGVDRVVFSIGYRGDLVRQHLGDGGQFGLQVGYVDEGEALLGTGGALRLAFDQGTLDPVFLVLYGDSYLPIDLTQVEAAFVEQSAPVLMTVYRDRAGLERPNVAFDGIRVTRYQKGLEKPPKEMQWVDYGLSVWQRRVVESFVPKDDVVDLADLFVLLSRSGQLAGLETDQRFYEIGSPAGLSDLESRLRAGGALAVPPNTDR